MPECPACGLKPCRCHDEEFMRRVKRAREFRRELENQKRDLPIVGVLLAVVVAIIVLGAWFDWMGLE